jgi:hypothetical protein
MTTEIVWLGHDNTIDLLLKAEDANGDQVAQDLSSVNKITASFGSKLISSTEKAAGLITWDQAGYDIGEIRIDVGGETIAAAGYDVPIITYDADNPDGIVWGEVSMLVKDDVEASP